MSYGLQDELKRLVLVRVVLLYFQTKVVGNRQKHPVGSVQPFVADPTLVVPSRCHVRVMARP